jgi:hypothetical protein
MALVPALQRLGLLTPKSEVALAEAQVRGTQVSTARACASLSWPAGTSGAKQTQAAAEKRLSLAQESLNRNIQARVSAQTALNSVTAVGSWLGSIASLAVFRLVLLCGAVHDVPESGTGQIIRSGICNTIDAVRKDKINVPPKFLIMRPKPVRRWRNRLVDAQVSK